MTPLRQFRGVPGEVLRKAEAKQFVGPFILRAKAQTNWNPSPGIATSTSVLLNSVSSSACKTLASSCTVWCISSLSLSEWPLGTDAHF